MSIFRSLYQKQRTSNDVTTVLKKQYVEMGRIRWFELTHLFNNFIIQ